MSTRAASAGRARPVQVHAIHFDRLMEAVKERKGAHEATGEERGPATARSDIREPLSPVGNTRQVRFRPHSARPSFPSAGPGTPRDIMAAAVKELPSLTDTLQEGKWITSQEAAGELFLLLSSPLFVLCS